MTGAQLVRVFWNFLNATGDNFLASATTTALTWIQFFGLLLAASGLGWLIGIAILAATTASFYYLGWLGALGIVFGVLSLLAYTFYLGSGDTNEGLLWYAGILAALGAAVAGVSMVRPSALPKSVAVVGFILDISSESLVVAYH